MLVWSKESGVSNRHETLLSNRHTNKTFFATVLCSLEGGAGYDCVMSIRKLHVFLFKTTLTTYREKERKEKGTGTGEKMRIMTTDDDEKEADEDNVSWRILKERARIAFDRGDYPNALIHYAAALQPQKHCPVTERQLILSNMVATRLHIGGPGQVEAAVENAKQVRDIRMFFGCVVDESFVCCRTLFSVFLFFNALLSVPFFYGLCGSCVCCCMLFIWCFVFRLICIKCVALNDRWAKGHVRLASAYIALGGHSNDACNALQKALQLDPRYPNARQLLIQELRRRQGNPTTTSTSTPTTTSTSTTRFQEESSIPISTPPQPSAPPEDDDIDRAVSYGPQPSAPLEDEIDNDYSNGNPYTTNPTTTTATPPSGGSIPGEGRQGTFENPYREQPQQRQQPHHERGQQQQQQRQQQREEARLDDEMTLIDSIFFYLQRIRVWYSSQSEDVRSLLLVLLGVFCMYIAFGGRFGLGGVLSGHDQYHHHHQQRRGNYNRGNAYDQFYDRQYGRASSTTNNDNNMRASSSRQRDRYGYHPHESSSWSSQDSYQQSHNYGDRDDYYSTRRNTDYQQRGRERRSSSFWSSLRIPNLLDGSLQSTAILAGIVYVCHRNGISPMQIMVLLNMIGHRGHRRFRRAGPLFGGYGGGGLFGRGMGGFGGGMGGFGLRGLFAGGRPRW